jgi:hypothetical protein
MNTISIPTNDTYEQIVEIIQHLIKPTWPLREQFGENISCFGLGRKKIIESEPKKLYATIVSAYTEINKMLRKIYKDNLQVIHSFPIDSIDWEESNAFVEKTQKA